MTDAEAYLVEEPVPLGPRGDYRPKFSGYMGFERVFDCVWSGRRHVMIGPIADRSLGPDQPVRHRRSAPAQGAMLGMRGLPGNSIHHANSMFVTNHGKRVFVEGEVDIVGGVGYNPRRWPEGARREHVDLRLIVTDLACSISVARNTRSACVRCTPASRSSRSRRRRVSRCCVRSDIVSDAGADVRAARDHPASRSAQPARDRAQGESTRRARRCRASLRAPRARPSAHRRLRPARLPLPDHPDRDGLGRTTGARRRVVQCGCVRFPCCCRDEPG